MSVKVSDVVATVSVRVCGGGGGGGGGGGNNPKLKNQPAFWHLFGVCNVMTDQGDVSRFPTT